MMDFTTGQGWLALTNAFAEPDLSLDAEEEHDASASTERLSALALSGERAMRAEFPRNSAADTIQLIVGERPIRLALLSGLHVWAGSGSAWPNAIANNLLHGVVEAVALGDMAASDIDRNRLLGAHQRPWTIPVLRGPCVVAGADAGGGPDRLPESFMHWWLTNALRISEDAADWRLEADAFDTLSD